MVKKKSILTMLITCVVILATCSLMLMTTSSAAPTTESVVTNVANELNAVYVDQSEVNSEGSFQESTQRVVLTWENDISNLSNVKLVYLNEAGKEKTIAESSRTDKSILFIKNMDTAEEGTYTLKGVRYQVEGDDEVQFFEFSELEIDASFAVVDEETQDQVTTVEASADSISSVDDKVSDALEQAGISTTLLSSKANPVIVLDPGHGLWDAGACYGGLEERVLNIKIANACKEELEAYGAVVYLTHPTADTRANTANDDGGQELQARVDIAKSYNADLLVSLHNNASTNTSSNGAVIYYPNSNYRSDLSTTGKAVAQNVLDELGSLGLKKNSIQYYSDYDDGTGVLTYPDGSVADYYGIIRRAKLAGISAILVEHAFMSNSSDLAKLKDDAFLTKIGVADAAGIAKYFGLQKGTWEKDATGWKWKNNDGTYQGEGWKRISGEWYLFNADGYILTGLQYDGTAWYYLYEDGGYKCDGWVQDNGKWYLFDASGKAVTGWKQISGKWYYMDPSTAEMKIGAFVVDGKTYCTNSDGVMQTGWYKVGSNWYYLNTDGSAKTGWFTSGSVTYYFDPTTCIMATGKKTIDGKIYTFSTSGAMVKSTKTGWEKDGTDWYYLKKGTVYTGWLKSGGKWYYLDPSTGKMATGAITVSGKVYVMSSSGVMLTGWCQSGGYWYYTNSTGAAVSGWLKSGGKWYYLDASNGYKMTTGWLVNGGNTYYLDPSSGAMVTGTRTIDDIVYKFNSSGVLVSSSGGWTVEDGNRYYYKDGSKVSGWLQIGSDWYYFDPNNGDAMATGWIQTTKWYYLGTDGKMLTGWQKVNNVWYYMNPENGDMVTGEQTIEGTKYYFASSGAWIESPYEITGTSSVTAAQLAAYFTAAGKTYPAFYASDPSGATTLLRFCEIYVEEAAAENIKVEVAFAQAMKETAWLKYGGDVPQNYYNFAGLGATGGGNPGNQFANVRQGIRAQIQHLKAYANKEALNQTCVDTRFSGVTRGSAPIVQWLGIPDNPYGKGWAAASNYGSSLLTMISAINKQTT